MKPQDVEDLQWISQSLGRGLGFWQLSTEGSSPRRSAFRRSLRRPTSRPELKCLEKRCRDDVLEPLEIWFWTQHRARLVNSNRPQRTSAFIRLSNVLKRENVFVDFDFIVLNTIDV